MTNRKRGLFLGGILLFFLLVALVKIQAQNVPPALIVHPTNLDLSIDSGGISQGILYVKNTTKQSLEVKTELRNFTAEGEEGGVAITSENTPFSLASWVKVSPQVVTIAPGQEVQFNYSINPPSNAEAGGHFGSIVFATVPPKNAKGGALLSQEIASLFLVRIPGPVVEKASIVSFDPEKGFYEFGPVNFNLRVKDEGGVHVHPAGVITITDMFGNKSIFGFQGQNVLPGAIRRMTTSYQNTWLIGKYSAALALTYGSKNSQLYASTEFWAFPWRIGLVVLAGLIILFFFRKRLWKAVRIIIRGK